MLDNAKGPPLLGTATTPKVVNEACTNESNNTAAKRKPKNFWYENGGRYLYRCVANGSTVFDVWIGEPLPESGRA